jgi:DNA invertase Pin-like site-specific DNA recombinase
MANLLLSMLGAVAEFERSLILERQREGIQLAKAQGAYKGCKPSLTSSRVQLLREAAAAGESKTALAKRFNVSTDTVYTYLNSARNS